jgi:hypothetical protein
VFITRTKDKITALKQLVFDKYKYRDLSPISYYLGIRIRCDRCARAIKLSIELYIKKLVKDYNCSYVTCYNLIDVKALKLKLCRADDACDNRSL